MSTAEDDRELIAIHLFGWKWMRYVGIPIRGTEGYPAKRHVRQFMNPETIALWKKDSRFADMTEATGDEPLSYAYCSSHGAYPPDFSDSDVREAVKQQWNDERRQLFEGLLPDIMRYRVGDFTKAAAKVIRKYSTESREP